MIEKEFVVKIMIVVVNLKYIVNNLRKLDTSRLGNPYKITYYCNNCNKENVLYWGRRKIAFRYV